MKTKISIHLHDPVYVSGGTQCQQIYIQILDQRYKFDKTSKHLESIGTIRLQRNLETPNEWYGLRFEINTSDISHIEGMLKLAKFIKENVENFHINLDVLLESIGASRHVYSSQLSNYVPISENGWSVYEVDHGGKCWTRISAPNLPAASKEWKRIIKKNGWGKSDSSYLYKEQLVLKIPAI